MFQIEVILDTVSRFASETKVALEQVISSTNPERGDKGDKGDKHDKGDKEKSKRSNIGDVLGRTLKNVSGEIHADFSLNYHEPYA